MPRFYGKGKDLTVYAPPPPWFESTLEKLRLNFDFEAAKSLDKINHWKVANPKMRNRSPELEILPPDEITNDVKSPLLS